MAGQISAGSRRAGGFFLLFLVRKPTAEFRPELNPPSPGAEQVFPCHQVTITQPSLVSLTVNSTSRPARSTDLSFLPVCLDQGKIQCPLGRVTRWPPLGFALWVAHISHTAFSPPAQRNLRRTGGRFYGCRRPFHVGGTAPNPTTPSSRDVVVASINVPPQFSHTLFQTRFVKVFVGSTQRPGLYGVASTGCCTERR